MGLVLGIVGIKAGIAVLLSLGATAAGRWARRPALAHALWVIVLLELLVPPLLVVGVLPPPEKLPELRGRLRSR